MSAPIIDAAKIAATIDAFRFANAPQPSVSPEPAGALRAPVIIQASSSAPAPDGAATVVDLSVVATTARATMERTLLTSASANPSPGASASPGNERPPAVTAPIGTVASPEIAGLARPIAPQVDATFLAAARAMLDKSYLSAGGGVRLAAALLALQPTEQIFAALDRRVLFAIAADPAGAFSPVERRGARAWLERLASAILAGLKGPETSDQQDMILKGFIRFLDAAGPEEMRSAEWVVQRAAAQLGRERLAATGFRLIDDPAQPAAMVDIVKAALMRPVGGFQPIADATALVAHLRDTPLLATAFLTPEMLLVGLAAFHRAGVWRARDQRPSTRAPRRARPDEEALLILPLEKDWESVPDAAPAIEAWERSAGRALPDDYLAFLEIHNGGRIWPNMFDYSVPLTGASTSAAMTFLDRLYAWGAVEDVWRGERFAGCLPPDMLAIGCDPGGMEILLSLRTVDLGAISCWPHSTEPWGTRTNRDIYPLAGSFEAFLARLRDEPGGAGHRYWDRPALRRLVRRVEIW